MRLGFTVWPSQTQPVPGDVWSHRSECVELGRKKLAAYKKEWYGQKDWTIEVYTNYAGSTSRCYVQIQAAGGGLGGNSTSYVTLWDGQTNEQLAKTSWFQKNYKSDFFGEVTAGGYFHMDEVPHNYDPDGPNHEDWLYAGNWINDRMAEK
jgi:hypothetical protein